jgi:predicted RNA-binding Zn-ribbon protein involved in translation (DUF1610 family)
VLAKNLTGSKHQVAMQYSTCPHCQKELPENYGAAWCPSCGKDLIAHSDSEKIRHGGGEIRWCVFFILFFAPILLTILAVLLSAKNGSAPPAIAFLGGGVSGIICGAMLGHRIGRTIGARIGLGILFAIMLVVADITMDCFGCLASGYQVNFH